MTRSTSRRNAIAASLSIAIAPLLAIDDDADDASTPAPINAS